MPVGDRGGDATRRAIGGGHRRRARFAVLAVVVGLVLGASSLLAWYIDAQWFDSLGYSDVFWTTLQLKSSLFSGVTLVTFLLVYAALRLLQPPQLRAPVDRVLYVNGQPVSLSLGPVVRLVTWAVALVVALGAGSGMMSEWTTFGLYLARAGRRGRSRVRRPHLRTAAGLLPLHAARLAARWAPG